MIVAAIPDKEHVVAILLASFDGNPSARYVTGNGKGRLKRLKALMEYSFDRCLESGRIYLNDDKTACALVLFPDRKKISFSAVIRDCRLIIRCIGISRLGKILKRNRLIAKQYPDQPIYYLWFIGVLPGNQGQGAGTRLLRTLIAESADMNRKLLLETSVFQNIGWYEKHGFQCYRQLDLGYMLYFMEHNHPLDSGRLLQQ